MKDIARELVAVARELSGLKMKNASVEKDLIRAWDDADKALGEYFRLVRDSGGSRGLLSQINEARTELAKSFKVVRYKEKLGREWLQDKEGSTKELTAGSNHRDFDNKKDAIAFLKKNALMSVGWPEGRKQKVAIYWNGRLHVEDAKTKKYWGAHRELTAGRSSRDIDVKKAIRLVKVKRMEVVSAGPGRTHSFDQRGALHEVEEAMPHNVGAELFDNGGVLFRFGGRHTNNFIEFE
jgi:hypothetical protein